jgi:hypothetical protein
LIQNAQNIGLVDTIFEELVSNKSFTKKTNFLRSYAIRCDHQNKENAARQIHGSNENVLTELVILTWTGGMEC